MLSYLMYDSLIDLGLGVLKLFPQIGPLLAKCVRGKPEC